MSPSNQLLMVWRLGIKGRVRLGHAIDKITLQ